MSRSKMALCAVMLVLLISIRSFAFFSQTPSSTPPPHSVGPNSDYDAAQPDSRDVLRFRRGERYNIPNPNLSELTESSPAVLLELPHSHATREATPFATSDTVVVATIKSGSAFLSNDRRDIYSEFRATIDDVLKTPSTPHLRVGDSIVVHRHGGSIKLPSGKSLVRGAVGDSMPVVGGQYLLFLKYDPSTEDYHVETGYQLQNGHAYHLDSDTPSNGSVLQAEPVSADEFILRAKNLAERKDGNQ